MSQGNYDHPSYITRQYDYIGKTTAGANTLQTALYATYPNNVRVRNISAFVQTAGTSTANALQILCIGTCTQYVNGTATVGTGTTSLGQVLLGTAVANTAGTSGDLNTCINSGSIIAARTSADATGVFSYSMELHTDPGAAWAGN